MKIQVSQFQEGLAAEKNNALLEEKRNAYSKLYLLSVDLRSIIDTTKDVALVLGLYYEREQQRPLESNILIKRSLRSFSRFLEIDRLSIFNGFNIFMSHRKDWIEEFGALYNLLDFLPEYLTDIYKKYDNHAQDVYQKKMEVVHQLKDLMDELSKLINDYLFRTDGENIGHPFTELANDTISKYYRVINSGTNEDGIRKETDLEQVKEEVLFSFINRAMEFREVPNFDSELEPLVARASTIRKNIAHIKEISLQFSESMKKEYKNLKIDAKDQKSYLSIILELQEILKMELAKIRISN